ncbi:MAG: molybdenum cofactor biosynthesis protein B [Alphaproteobacteria bacterium]|nr:molybdenum cofactor biosynthesis protein B [Alphaproteobacteria bacterium]
MSASRIDETKTFLPVRIAVLTVSDTRGPENDTSGDTLVERLTGAGHALAERALLRDDVAMIREQLKRWIATPDIDVIITTGGTGLTGRDVTVEAMRPLFDKEIDGFSVLFHQISYEKVGTSTIQSRACAGLATGTLLFALPGSTGAVKDGWDGILKWQLDSRHRPCNFVELMPRFEEHLAPGKRKK